MVLLVSIWVFGIFVSIEGEEQGDLAILVDVPWTELRDFSAVLSALESKSSLRIHRFNLIEDVDWQVGHFMEATKNQMILLCFVHVQSLWNGVVSCKFSSILVKGCWSGPAAQLVALLGMTSPKSDERPALAFAVSCTGRPPDWQVFNFSC